MLLWDVASMTDYFEDWKNELLTWDSGKKDADGNVIYAKGSRGAIGMEVSRKMYDQEMKAIQDNIKRGAIKEPCITCKSLKTKQVDGIWECECGEKWDALKLRFRGM